MNLARHARISRIAAAVAGVAAVIAAGIAGGAGAASAAPAVVAHRITVSPELEKAGKLPNSAQFSCQTRPMDGSQGARCYTPAQIQNSYGIAPLLNNGTDGTGRTIVIVDAYSSPYVAQDLQIQDQTFGLPPAHLTQISPNGLTPFDINDPVQDSWAEEITLDVLWAHATAPGAKIVLDLARSSNDTDLHNAVKYAVDNNLGDVISQSYGEAETCMDPTLLAEQHQLFAQAAKKGITVFASSGDSGASQFNCAGTAAIEAASTPASDPYVTGVGGTTLTADPSTGAYQSETAWTEPFGCNPPAAAGDDVNCSGGGFSAIYSRPSFQSPVIHNPRSGRGVPDVAYDAGVSGGVLTHCGICNVLLGYDPTASLFFIFGGTSAGSPQWAGLIADGDQLAGRRLGDINPALYTLAQSRAQYPSALHDITTGNNDVSEIGTGYNAGRSWDAVTGLGTPIAAKLLPALAARTS
ncbi:MAG: S53 family peptidase [Mycobacterium sp.]|nr:S53 family peptidase [Mycobacterium sp.]